MGLPLRAELRERGLLPTLRRAVHGLCVRVRVLLSIMLEVVPVPEVICPQEQIHASFWAPDVQAHLIFTPRDTCRVHVHPLAHLIVVATGSTRSEDLSHIC